MIFDELDRDGNGKLDLAELRESIKAKPADHRSFFTPEETSLVATALSAPSKIELLLPSFEQEAPIESEE